MPHRFSGLVINEQNTWLLLHTQKSSKQKQKLQTITKNGLQMCKYKKVYADLVFFAALNDYIGLTTSTVCNA